MKEAQHLDSLISEYKSLLYESQPKNAQDNYNEAAVIDQLVKSADWSDRGASEILMLADQYGAFILRNALALAVALGKEDGALGL